MFKSKPESCIDLILTNKPKRFQTKGVMETGISDHHALILFWKATFTKIPPCLFLFHVYKILNNYTKKLVIQKWEIFL